MKFHIAALSLLALIFSLNISAKEVSLTLLSVTLCENGRQEEFNLEYGDGKNAFIPFKKGMSGLLDDYGHVVLKLENNQTLTLGIPTRSWGEGECVGYELSLTDSSYKVVFNRVDGIIYPCMGKGDFPHPALCQSDKIELNLSQNNAQMDTVCSEIFEVKNGSGGRVGGSCFN